MFFIPGLARRLALIATLAAMNAVSLAQDTTAEFDVAGYRGRVVVVDFWASWCKPCRQSIPWLNEMHLRYSAEGLVVLGVNVDADRADAEKFLRQTPIDFAVLFDSSGELARRFALQGMPSTLVFDRRGKLVATHLGFQQARKDLREAGLRNLLNEESR